LVPCAQETPLTNQEKTVPHTTWILASQPEAGIARHGQTRINRTGHPLSRGGRLQRRRLAGTEGGHWSAGPQGRSRAAGASRPAGRCWAGWSNRRSGGSRSTRPNRSYRSAGTEGRSKAARTLGEYAASFAGYTSPTTGAIDGREAAHVLCNATFPSSHLCHYAKLRLARELSSIRPLDRRLKPRLQLMDPDRSTNRDARRAARVQSPANPPPEER
jgi:hypothetical protein